MSLAPCPSCARHVRRGESRCPFCNGSVSLPPPPTRVIGERLGRAALFTVGAAIVSSTACAHPVYGGPPSDVGPAARDAGIAADGGGGTLYGGPPDAADDIDTGG